MLLSYLTENERLQAFRQRKNHIVLKASDDLWCVQRVYLCFFFISSTSELSTGFVQSKSCAGPYTDPSTASSYRIITQTKDLSYLKSDTGVRDNIMCYKYQITATGPQNFQLCLRGVGWKERKLQLKQNKIFQNEFSFGEFQSQNIFTHCIITTPFFNCAFHPYPFYFL